MYYYTGWLCYSWMIEAVNLYAAVYVIWAGLISMLIVEKELQGLFPDIFMLLDIKEKNAGYMSSLSVGWSCRLLIFSRWMCLFLLIQYAGCGTFFFFLSQCLYEDGFMCSMVGMALIVKTWWFWVYRFFVYISNQLSACFYPWLILAFNKLEWTCMQNGLWI